MEKMKKASRIIINNRNKDLPESVVIKAIAKISNYKPKGFPDVSNTLTYKGKVYIIGIYITNRLAKSYRIVEKT